MFFPKTLWSGKININNITWEYHNIIEKFPNESESKRLELWQSRKKQFPWIYDADLLKLSNFNFDTKNNSIHLELTPI